MNLHHKIITNTRTILIVSVLLMNPLGAQHTYPADSLLQKKDIGIVRKLGLYPIAAWQRISYNTHLLDCQFRPSCSNYGLAAIAEKGIILGSIITSDRITRCNPAAYYYHLEQGYPIDSKTGRLIDPLRPSASPTPNSHPLFSAGLSMILPGAGRCYSGKWIDGISGFLLVSMTAILTQEAYQRGHPARAGLFGFATFIVYSGEIYGAYRTAKYSK